MYYLSLAVVPRLPVRHVAAAFLGAFSSFCMSLKRTPVRERGTLFGWVRPGVTRRPPERSW